jgi:DNA-binding transcriptional MerR regulator
MDSKHQPTYAIREVAELTGVKPVTLRAWQRRYNLIQPQRSQKGHRLYSQQDVDRINEIQRWLLKGASIGRVMSLLEGSDQYSDDAAPFPTQLEVCEELLQALASLNRGRAESMIMTTFKEYPLEIVESQLIVPVLATIDKMKASQRSLQFSLFHALLNSRLLHIIEAENKASSKGRMLCISLEPLGSLHALLWACQKAEQGFHVTLLDGVDDISGLVGHSGVTHFDWVEIFSNNALTERQCAAIDYLIAEGLPLTCAGIIPRLGQISTLNEGSKS